MEPSVSKSVEEKTIHLTCQGELTIPYAKAWQDIILSHFEPEKDLSLDLEHVHKIDTAGVQVLVFLKKKLALTSKVLSLANHSPSIKKVWDLLGLVSFFGDKIRLKKEERESYSFRYGVKRI